MAQRYHFNLLSKRKVAFSNEFLSFIQRYVRYILISTQLVVLAVFFVKILLDQSIVDLKESIDQKNQIILAAQPLIRDNNQFAEKIDLLDGLIEKQRTSYGSMFTVLDNVPETITVTKFTYNRNQITLSGSTFEANDIKKFEARLKKKLPNSSVVIQKIIIQQRSYQFELVISYEA